MAAPFRKVCLVRYLRGYHSVLKLDTGKQHVLSAATHRVYSNRSQEDFYGISADLHSRPDDEAALSADKPNKEDSAAVIESLLKRSRRRRKKSMEVTMQTTFGEVRLDKAARKPYLESLSTDKFWEVIHSPVKISGAKKNTAIKGLNKRKKDRKQAANRTAPAADPAVEGKNLQTSDIRIYDAANYFDEVYFGQKSSHKDPQGVPSSSEIVPDLRIVSPETTGAHETQERQKEKQSASKHYVHHITQTSESDSDRMQLPRASDSYFDEAYFSTVLKADNVQSSEESSTHSDASCIEEQYLSESFKTQATAEDCHNQKTERDGSSEEFSFIDSQYFDKTDALTAGEASFSHVTNQYAVTDSKTQEMLSHHILPETENLRDVSADVSPSSNRATSTQQRLWPATKQSWLEQQETQKNTQTVKRIGVPRLDGGVKVEVDPAELKSKTERTQLKDVISSDHASFQKGRDMKPGATADMQRGEKKETAYDVAMKIRKQIRTPGLKDTEDELSESKQRVLKFKEQVPDLYNMPSAEITKLLADSVIFENDDFFALSKPYGLPSHGGPSVRASVGQLLEPLAHRLDKGRGLLPTLYLVHRLDKETTGVMLLAKNAEVAWQLLGMFRRREVKKKYWAITKGVPQPSEGIIDIPLARQRVHGVYKTIVKPEKFVVGGRATEQKWGRRDDHSMEAITEYRVLSHQDSMALVELRPTTGVQHQIRAHLAQALNAPVLGDHKYSHMDKLAPQRLFPEALQKLGIRQAQVRYLPMHLHAKTLVLPEWRGRHNVFINAAIPKYFLRNLRTLKIKIPQE